MLSVVLFRQVGCLCVAELSLTLVLIQQTLPRGCKRIYARVSACKKKKKKWQSARLSIGVDQLNMTREPAVRDIMPQTQGNTKGQV